VVLLIAEVGKRMRRKIGRKEKEELIKNRYTRSLRLLTKQEEGKMRRKIS
jgi:hypothetical protein